MKGYSRFDCSAEVNQPTHAVQDLCPSPSWTARSWAARKLSVDRAGRLVPEHPTPLFDDFNSKINHLPHDLLSLNRNNRAEQPIPKPNDLHTFYCQRPMPTASRSRQNQAANAETTSRPEQPAKAIPLLRPLPLGARTKRAIRQREHLIRFYPAPTGHQLRSKT